MMLFSTGTHQFVQNKNWLTAEWRWKQKLAGQQSCKVIIISIIIML